VGNIMSLVMLRKNYLYRAIIISVASAIGGTQGFAIGAPCAPQGAMNTHLADNYKMKHFIDINDHSGKPFEVYASDSGYWAILDTNTKSISCIVSSGKAPANAWRKTRFSELLTNIE